MPGVLNFLIQNNDSSIGRRSAAGISIRRAFLVARLGYQDQDTEHGLLYFYRGLLNRAFLKNGRLYFMGIDKGSGHENRSSRIFPKAIRSYFICKTFSDRSASNSDLNADSSSIKFRLQNEYAFVPTPILYAFVSCKRQVSCK
jgi:hypothetical protein